MSLSTTDQHLSEEALQHFAQAPEQEGLQQQRLHLLECQDCLCKLQNLQSLESLVKRHADVISSDAQTSALKSQLHELTHQYAMENALESSTKGSASSLTQRLLSLFDIRTPILAVPTAATAAFLFALVIFAPDDSNRESGIERSIESEIANIASFQDSKLLALNKPQAQPGLGFFHGDGKAERLVPNYEGFNIKSDSSAEFIEISWQAIDQINRYNVTLYEISNNVRQQIKQTNTEQTHWQISRSDVQAGQLYRLTLSGNTHDNLSFRHTGGFVLR